MIGLSISFCIKEISAGQVALADVEKIVSGTSCHNADAWERLIKMYRESYWRDNPDECERILRQLLAEDKIYQPRVNGGRPPLLASDNGFTKWVNSESEIRYCELW
jgi:hypothetical protein